MVPHFLAASHLSSVEDVTLFHLVEAGGVLGSPGLVPACVTGEARVFNGDETLRKEQGLVVLLYLLEHVGIGRGIDFHDMGADIAGICGNADCRLARFRHMAFHALRSLHAMAGFSKTLGDIPMAIRAEVLFDQKGSLVGVVAVDAGPGRRGHRLSAR